MRLFSLARVDLTIVRRYVDMNGRYVGELYLGKDMIGASLDSLPLNYRGGRLWFLDTRRDFLKPLGFRTVRVGGGDPKDHEFVQDMIRKLASWNMRLTVMNNFVEHVMEAK